MLTIDTTLQQKAKTLPLQENYNALLLLLLLLLITPRRELCQGRKTDHCEKCQATQNEFQYFTDLSASLLAEHMSNYLCNLGLGVLRKVQFIGFIEAQPTGHNKCKWLTTPIIPSQKYSVNHH